MKQGRHFLHYLWDFVFFVFVLFPILGGGVWFHEPGLKLELTQVLVPTIVLGLISFFIFNEELDPFQCLGARLMHKIWHFWQIRVLTKPKKTLFMAALIYGVVLGFASIRRHWAFESGVADLGIFTSAIWNLSHGNGYISSVKDGINLFADHQSPIFYLFAPFFWLYPKAETLLLLQGLVISLGAIPLFGIALQYLGKSHWALALFPLLYWFYQPLRNANAFDFHPEITLLPCFLLFIYLAQSVGKKYRYLAIPAFFLALGTKESAGPVMVGLCLMWLAGGAAPESKKSLRIWALPGLFVGLGVFLFNLKVVPTFFADNYRYMDAYSQLGNSLGEILLSPFTKPKVFLYYALLEKARLKFLFESLSPFAFLPLLAPLQLFVSVPGFLMLFLENDSHRVSTGFHYISEPAVGIFLALIVALGSYKKPDVPLNKILIIRVWVVLLFCSLAMYGRGEIFRIRFNAPTAYQNWLRKEALPAIETTASVSASGAFSPHLSNRFWINYLPRTKSPSGENLDCVVRDDKVNNWPLQNFEVKQVQTALDQDFDLEFSCQSFMVYKRKGRAESCLRRIPKCPDDSTIANEAVVISKP